MTECDVCGAEFPDNGRMLCASCNRLDTEALVDVWSKSTWDDPEKEHDDDE